MQIALEEGSFVILLFVFLSVTFYCGCTSLSRILFKASFRSTFETLMSASTFFPLLDVFVFTERRLKSHDLVGETFFFVI